MEKIFKYLEFLLPVHNCVIVPELGGFILNLEPARLDAEGKLLPPSFRVIFNQDLTHNDGILISRFIKDEGISHNVASVRLKELVKILKKNLDAGHIVMCGSLGVISLTEEGNILFAAKDNYHPDLFGLTPIFLRKFSDIENILRKERKTQTLQYAVGSIAAVAAALFLFVGPSISIKDRSQGYEKQEAGFIQSLTRSFISSTIKADSSMLELVVNVNDKKTSLKSGVGDVSEPSSTRSYYVVVGGEDSKLRAERLLNKIRTSDFRNAAIVESGERYRVYVASFTDRVEGETFLEAFRKENPKYESAWLYSQRN